MVPPSGPAEVLAELRGSAAIDVSSAQAISPADQALRSLLGATKDVIREAPDSVTCKFLTRAVAARLLRAQTISERRKERLSSVVKLSTRQLEVVREYIERNLAHAISVQDLAASVGMSRAPFSRRFNVSTGMTPHQAVTAARIEMAKALLLDKAESIDEVAKRCGFSKASHFSSVFRRNLKMSPSAYRAQMTAAEAPRSLTNGCDIRCDTRLAAENARPSLSAVVPEFSLERTTLYSGNSRQLVASSEGLGWTDLFAAVTEELPHETLHRAVPDVWLASALTDVDIQRVGAGYEDSQVLPKGTITITGADEAVYDKTAAALKVAYVYLRREVIDNVAKELFRDAHERRHVNSMLCSNDVILQRLVALIMMLLKDPVRNSRLEVDYLSQALAARLLEKHSVVGPVRSGPRIQSFNSMEIGRIVEYVNENLMSDLGVSDLAGLVGLGRAQFISRFKATTTLTPHQFVILRRIWKARNLLAGRDGGDQESIAERCGFANRAHFITSFRKVVGMTPHEYRLVAD